MIYGIGTDIIEIKRIKDAVEKWGERFLNKIFTKNEIAYCCKKKDPFPHLAVRFAAKEAVIKAISLEDRGQKTDGLPRTGTPVSKTFWGGDDRPIKIANFRNIEILNHPTGKPFINLLGDLKESFQDKFIIHLTLTHERSYAVATVVLETKNS